MLATAVIVVLVYKNSELISKYASFIVLISLQAFVFVGKKNCLVSLLVVTIYSESLQLFPLAFKRWLALCPQDIYLKS